ncbi:MULTISPECIES: bis(5'-nucleosyl)-tetraphosphatase PrpE [Pontibacillus]|uniref:Bis(5'-nucleosyl)-tetraphosphatase PrpE n=1 Tax=Pontibacillus chungwhensis TaxID=265426 RepID=A0ABY8UZC0_9BACI|nr:MULTISPECIES: bis(5'-nucleosyl)-tetraphosphatase PrpE [Pontibacillus]MCD5324669.1 bis(5'-nucleosyl)-tetraphosphatase PrpE [Pontibacillus sp. HN14]WIF99036.1 bis(5'-nucleosyl)-tetraphosphatase PrpE [Pontibacillus chungwhensis]
MKKLDCIGDVHGCYDELIELFTKLGYSTTGKVPRHPEGRIPVFVGDLTDRGPASLDVIRLVYRMVVVEKMAKYVPGNHCNKLYRFFKGNPVKHKHGLETTVAEYEALSKDEQRIVKDQFITLYEESPLYLEDPEANVVIAHAGIREDMIGKSFQNKKVRTFVLYGDVTGEFDENGMPVRRDWAADYEGGQWIVYGHTPVREPRFKHKTVNIDTGCVFGGALTCFRLPEEEIRSVPSKQPEVPEKFRSFDD